jgi:hypothetical protein
VRVSTGLPGAGGWAAAAGGCASFDVEAEGEVEAGDGRSFGEAGESCANARAPGAHASSAHINRAAFIANKNIGAAARMHQVSRVGPRHRPRLEWRDEAFRAMLDIDKVERLIRPEVLKNAEPLFWSTGTGTDVWDPPWATPLAWATRRGHLDIVRLLTEAR